jgi:AmmeMemoRadiSam system protein B
MVATLARKKRIRTPVAAGMFYPEGKNDTLNYIKSFGLKKGEGGQAQAIIVPHGAWDFSGSLAGAAFSRAAGNVNVKRVVILGPIHDKREKGIFLSNSHYFGTPLGKLPVDKDVTEELEFYGNNFKINDIPHLGEHSIEVLLPFIKYCFPDASIVPVLMGQSNPKNIEDMAQSLKTVISPILNETLLVVSCNLSCSSDIETARHSAKECLRLFTEKDFSAIASAITSGRLNACGWALAAGLFKSGLLDEKQPYSFADKMVYAVGSMNEIENNTVFYGAVSFE